MTPTSRAPKMNRQEARSAQKDEVELSDILKRILAVKAQEIAPMQKERPTDVLERRARAAPPARDLTGAPRAKLVAARAGVSAEIKKASPSRGVLRELFEPAAI